MRNGAGFSGNRVLVPAVREGGPMSPSLRESQLVQLLSPPPEARSF